MVERRTIPCLWRPDNDVLTKIAFQYLKEREGKNNNKSTQLNLKNKIYYQLGIRNTEQGMNMDDSVSDSLSFLEMTEETFKTIVKKYGKKT